MKKTFVLILGLFLIVSCGSDPKKKDEPKNDNTNTEEVKTEVTQPSYPKLTDVPPQLNYIFDNGFEFAEDIKIEFIALENKGDNKYQLIYGLNEDTDYAKLETLKVSSVFYAEDASQFKDEIYRKRKSRQVPAPCKLYSLDGDVVVIQDFEMEPKDHKQVKFYFYNDQGVVNDKMLTVRNIKLP